ncbi:unnamed protein product [Kuraishia capsulata CBS 1993]|uniref:Cyclin-like domain-containing protein n=1 Tax=Kuraishia capsulata CBS 1993 TaxID=1382522 RepID=W6MSD3_9ASCO|nr:uncharacterized protein KUCA_T00005607001 [Kuraishia capsulata CBS 1993]CDK29614.1 unnamed protein product [Kuraishia capsulata CBS 1993]
MKNFPPVPRDRFVYTHNPVPYPNELLVAEIATHHATAQEYRLELTSSAIADLDIHRPDIGLISKQPQLTPDYRIPLMDFLARCARKTRVAPMAFYRAARLFDRYCSRRVVLVEQAKLVAATCLWLAAKADGGFNHPFSSAACPTGGRFLGPSVRARIPRLAELCSLCEPVSGYDEGMFVQMERHVLDTLDWQVTEPTIHEWVMTAAENSTASGFLSDQNADVVALKLFLCDCTLYSTDLISIHPAELAASVHDVLSRICGIAYDSEQYGCTLPRVSRSVTVRLLEAISQASPGLLRCSETPVVPEFARRARWYWQSLQAQTPAAPAPSPSPDPEVFAEYHHTDDSDVDSIFDQCMSSMSSFAPSPMVTPNREKPV